MLETNPDLSEALKWQNSSCEEKGSVCYLAANKGYISLGFFNSTSFTDTEGRIEYRGEKMKDLKSRGVQDIQTEQHVSWVGKPWR